MLRSLESVHRETILLPYSLSCTASGVAFNYGKSLFSTAVRNSAGNYTLTLKSPLNRRFINVSSLVLNPGNGGYALGGNANGASLNTLNIVTKGNDGANLEPAGIDGILLGYRTAEADKYSGKLFEVHAPMLAPRFLFGQISSAGASTIGSGDFISSKTATGTYSISFRKEFGQTPVIVVMGYDDATATTVSVKTKTASTCEIEVYDQNANALVDGAFSIFVLGSQAVGECGHESFRTVLTTQRNCRIAGLCGLSLNSATFTVGGPTTGKDFTSQSTASANATFNITDTFARSSVVVANGDSTILRFLRRGNGISSASQISLKSADFGGLAFDSGFDAIVVGSDDSTEYFSAS